MSETKWTCRHVRHHGYCNTVNDAEEETCGACGASPRMPLFSPPPAAPSPEPDAGEDDAERRRTYYILRDAIDCIESEAVHRMTSAYRRTEIVTRLRALAESECTSSRPALTPGICQNQQSADTSAVTHLAASPAPAETPETDAGMRRIVRDLGAEVARMKATLDTVRRLVDESDDPEDLRNDLARVFISTDMAAELSSAAPSPEPR